MAMKQEVVLLFFIKKITKPNIMNINTKKVKQLILKIVIPFVYVNGYCKTCTCKLDNNSYGEKKYLRWVRWCYKCYKSNFINQVDLSPMALSKYYNIYSKHPKDVI
jgi:hypothetical protein